MQAAKRGCKRHMNATNHAAFLLGHELLWHCTSNAQAPNKRVIAVA
jgi:hypothetical protein